MRLNCVVGTLPVIARYADESIIAFASATDEIARARTARGEGRDGLVLDLVVGVGHVAGRLLVMRRDRLDAVGRRCSAASRKPTLPWPHTPKRYGTFSLIRYSTMISAPLYVLRFGASAGQPDEQQRNRACPWSLPPENTAMAGAVRNSRVRCEGAIKPRARFYSGRAPDSLITFAHFASSLRTAAAN